MRERFSIGQKLEHIQDKTYSPLLAKSSVLRFGFLEDFDFWNQDVKFTLHVEQMGVEHFDIDLIQW